MYINKRSFIKFGDEYIYNFYMRNDFKSSINFTANKDFALSFKSYKSAVRFLNFIDTLCPGFSDMCEVI